MKNHLPLVCVLALTAFATPSIASELVDLRPGADNDPLSVVVSLRYAGAATAESPAKEGEAADAPLQGRLELSYRQASIDGGATGRVVRVVDQVSDNGLPGDRRVLVASRPDQLVKLVAPEGPLSRAELDTVQLTADPLDLAGVLPPEPLRDGATWTLEPLAVERLLRLDVSRVCEVVGVLSDVTPTHVRLRFAGPVHGTIDGADVEIDLRGVALFDRRRAQLTDMNLAWEESRSVGPATPAVDLTAKLNVSLEPTAPADAIDPETLAAAATAAVDDRLRIAPKGHEWRLLAGRDWFVVADTRTTTTLRRIEGRRVAAVTTLAESRTPAITLAEFEKEVRYALGDQLGQVISTTTGKLPGGADLLSIASVGRVDNEPVRWRHDHLSAGETAVSATTTLPAPQSDTAAGDTAIAELIASITFDTAKPTETASESTAVRR